MARRDIVRLGVGTAAVSGLVALARSRARRRLAHLERQVAGRAKHAADRLQGAAYRISGTHPSPEADDDVVEQRVRSSLGGLRKELDLPRVHVTVTDHVASLHGAVDTEDHRSRIEDAVESVDGVRAVYSYLHVGLGPGDTRPSEGRAHRPESTAHHELLGAVRALNVGDEEEVGRCVAGVLAVFVERLPADERRHLVAHLPVDVRPLLIPPRRIGGSPDVDSVTAFVDEVANAIGRTCGTAEQVSRAVLATLRELVPEEGDHVAAVLPAGLQELWPEPVAG